MNRIPLLPLAAALAGAGFLLAPAHAGLVISEFQAVNNTTLPDKEDQAYYDWVEIHNAGPGDVNLDGWYLTDRDDDLLKWRFPDITLREDRYVVVFASEENRHTRLSIFESAEISKTHTNFKLNSGGEYLALVRPDGFTVEHAYAPLFPPQGPDISFGLSAADGQPAYFLTPTPGKANGAGDTSVGPLIKEVRQAAPEGEPDLAADSQVVITAQVIPLLEDVSSVTLFYRYMFKSEASRAMKDDGVAPDQTAGDGVFSAAIPLQSIFGPVISDGQMIRWRVEATDEGGTLSRLPNAQDPLDAGKTPDQWRDSDAYFGTITRNDSILTSSLPVLHWFIENPRSAESDAGTRCAFYYLGEFYDNVQMDIHGQSTRGFPKKSYDLDFNEGNRFRYREGDPKAADINLLTNWADKSKVRNTMAYEMYDLGGVAGHFAFPIRIQQNGEFHSTADFVEDGDWRYLDRAGLNRDGALYKMYDSLSSTAQGEKKTREWEDKSDLQALINGVGRGSADEKLTYLYDNVDLAGMINFLTMNVVVNNTDYGHKNYYVYRDTTRTGEWVELPWDVDLSLGRQWTGSETYFHDPIKTVVNGVEDHVHGNVLATLVVNNPDFNTMLYRRIRTMMDYFYGPPGGQPGSDYMQRRLSELVELIDPEGVESDADLDYAKWGSWGNRDTMRAGVDRIRNEFIPGRRNYIYGLPKMPGPQPASPKVNFVELDYNPASGNQEEEYLVLQNTTGDTVDISGWSLSGAIDYTFRDGTVLLTGSLFTPDRGKIYVAKDAPAFRARTEGPRGGRKLFVQGGYEGQLTARGETLWLHDRNGTLIAEHTYPGEPSEAQQWLRVTEIHPAPLEHDESGIYHARDFEFVELRNVGPEPVDLEGVQLTDGVAFAFPSGVELAPGEYGVVVSNQAAFEVRYGSGIRVLGEYAGWLDNGGERFQLNDADGENVLKFTFDGDWFGESGDEGRSLVIVNDGAGFDTWGDPASWTVGQPVGGTPGRGESTSPPQGSSFGEWAEAYFNPAELEDPAIGGPHADPNGDGVMNVLAYAFGLHPRGAFERQRLPELTVRADGAQVLRFRKRTDSRDLNFQAQWSPDLENWSPSGGTEIVAENFQDGTQDVDLVIDDPNIGDATAGYFRIRVWLKDPLFIGPPVR